MHKLIKIVLAVLFLLCLLKMSYGYYQLVRFVAFVGFLYLAFNGYHSNKKTPLVYIALALLFQPFLKIALGRMLWNVVDVVVAISLLISLFLNYNRQDVK